LPYSQKTDLTLGDEPIQKKIKELMTSDHEDDPTTTTGDSPTKAARKTAAKTRDLTHEAEELSMDIDLLEDQLYDITGSLGIDLDFLKYTPNNLIEDGKDLIDLIENKDDAHESRASTPAATKAKESLKTTTTAATTTAGTSTKTTSKSASYIHAKDDLVDPSIFFDPDAHLPTVHDEEKKQEEEEDVDNDLDFAIEDFLEE
jgi:hypothetical protein